jgi:hypothetical protein
MGWRFELIGILGILGWWHHVAVQGRRCYVMHVIFSGKVMSGWRWLGGRPELFVHFGTFELSLYREAIFRVRIGQAMVCGSLFPLFLDVPRYLSSL